MATRDDQLTRMYEKHNRAIRAYCLRRIGDADASDAVSEVSAVAWRRIDDVPDDEMTLPWLYGVARRLKLFGIARKKPRTSWVSRSR
jgi:RNA polymerase sigma-70 factor (ECF subfamily)